MAEEPPPSGQERQPPAVPSARGREPHGARGRERKPAGSNSASRALTAAFPRSPDLPSKPTKVNALWASSQAKPKTGKGTNQAYFLMGSSCRARVWPRDWAARPRHPGLVCAQLCSARSSGGACQRRPRLFSHLYRASFTLIKGRTEPQGQGLKRLEDTRAHPLS